ncbi:uncharacterized protein LOC120916329 [Rana temporaria]|uniref:uncharacterized protein LOC120916329 n=1 Tax=Rana temporaria TaxID=8407 RepID=UPI001AAE0BD2|nr:uncharacterized protein LOC120916329 [Rana temporaria]
MSVLQLYVLLSVLAGTTHTKLCYFCWTYAYQANLCRWGQISCGDGLLCSTTIFEYYQDYTKERTYIYVFNDCIPLEQCNLIGSFSSGQESTWLATACCDTDFCTPDVPAIIRTSSEPNGVTCPACASHETLNCEPDGFMACRGDETNCALKTTDFTAYYAEDYMFYYWYGSGAAEYFNYTGRTPFWLQQISYRGCATDSVCEFGTQYLGKYTVQETVHYQCTGGTEESSSYPTALILCCIAHILLYLFIF